MTIHRTSLSGFAVAALLTSAAVVLLSGCGGGAKLTKKNTSAKSAALKAADSTAAQKKAASAPVADSMSSLSSATQLMLRACDNYIAVNPQSPKAAEVLTIKGGVYYNNRIYDKARSVYESIVKTHPKTVQAIDGVRMIAQSYYEEKKFDMAQSWYRKLKDMAGDGVGKQEATTRIAESVFKLAEAFEAQEKFMDAASNYERVALEFPDAKIADVSLFNAGLAYERLTEWSRAILAFEKLNQRYLASALAPKSRFRTAKCYEKLFQWDNAAQTYLRLVASYPSSDLAPAAIYNAGFSFENAEKLPEAAATFVKLAELYPASNDAADVLFRAGEIYGKLKDWENVTKVNREFTKRFGSDANRVVQALCMVGVALYMQNKPGEAIDQLSKAVTTFAAMSAPSTVNKYYAAKAEFTIGEINLEASNKIELIQPKAVYQKQLSAKSDLLKKAVDHYSAVIKYGISEWTTRGIFQIGQAYEDFAMGLVKQERSKSESVDEQLALEFGIAKAVEEYFVNKALHFHEQNVKLGIKEKLDDKYVNQSRAKLTALPCLAGENYINLVEISRRSAQPGGVTGFALIGQKLNTLQRIGPYQEQAIDLFLKCLELGSTYKQSDDYYKKASSLITKTCLIVGETYADVSTIAREAPIPEGLDLYEQFTYKINLLKKIEGYEDKALLSYVKALKIASAYTISDEFIDTTRVRLPRVLFVKGRCYDLLCINAFTNPPYPANATVAEKEEYKGRFEEVGMKLQEQSFDIYRSILAYAEQNYAAGEYVTHAYVRLYQNFKEEFGVKQEKTESKIMTSGPLWKCLDSLRTGWNSLDFDDSPWRKVIKGTTPKQVAITGFPAAVPPPMWWRAQGDSSILDSLYLRQAFYFKETPLSATLYATAVDDYTIYFNGTELPQDTGEARPWNRAGQWDLMGKVRAGKNVLAMLVKNRLKIGAGAYVHLETTISSFDFFPATPQNGSPLQSLAVAAGNYLFPVIKNFVDAPKAVAPPASVPAPQKVQ